MAAKRTMLNVHIMHASGDVIITTIRTALPKRGVWGNLLHLPRLLQQRPLPLQSNYRVKLMFSWLAPWHVARGQWLRTGTGHDGRDSSASPSTGHGGPSGVYQLSKSLKLLLPALVTSQGGIRQRRKSHSRL